MTSFTNAYGQLETVPLNLTSTNDTLIIAADQSIQWQLESLLASTDGTATTFFLWMTDGTTTVYLINGDTIAANKSLQIYEHSVKLKPGWSFKCKAGVGNHISVTASLLKISRSPTQLG